MIRCDTLWYIMIHYDDTFIHESFIVSSLIEWLNGRFRLVLEWNSTGWCSATLQLLRGEIWGWRWLCGTSNQATCTQSWESFRLRWRCGPVNACQCWVVTVTWKHQHDIFFPVASQVLHLCTDSCTMNLYSLYTDSFVWWTSIERYLQEDFTSLTFLEDVSWYPRMNSEPEKLFIYIQGLALQCQVPLKEPKDTSWASMGTKIRELK